MRFRRRPPGPRAWRSIVSALPQTITMFQRLLFPTPPALVAGALALACAAPAAAQPASDPPVPLPQFVVSATRTPQDLQFTPSSVTALSTDDLSLAQIPDLRTALAGVPGLYIASTGPTGGQSSVFLRGASSHQTLFIVDGVRMNDRAAGYFNFLGSADLAGLDRLEVLRGPQSTLYGSSAMGGVVLLDTAHGGGPAAGQVAVTGGSFDTFGATVAATGNQAGVGGSAAFGRLRTANDFPQNGYEQSAWSARVEDQLTPELLLGLTTRGQQGDYDEAGSRLYPSPGHVAADNYLTTAYGEWRPDRDFVSHLTVAEHQRRYTYRAGWGTSELRNRRDLVDWQNTWADFAGAEVVLGGNFERSLYSIDGVRTNDRSAAGFLSTTVHPARGVTVDAGLRYDHFSSVGGAATGRTGVSWVPVTGTKLRATYGTGFTAPGSDDRYGVREWGQLANPDLAPEKSQGWDVGVDQTLAGGSVAFSATYFHNRFRNLFEYEITDFEAFTGHIVNRARATTAGVELAAAATVARIVHARIAYTYLDARNDTDAVRLIRRPRQVVDVEVRVQPALAWTVGAGLHGVADRVESAGPIEDYTTARLFASYEVVRNLLLKARVENALNERYEEVLGYAALPRGAYGSVEWKF